MNKALSMGLPSQKDFFAIRRVKVPKPTRTISKLYDVDADANYYVRTRACPNCGAMLDDKKGIKADFDAFNYSMKDSIKNYGQPKK